MSTQPPVVVARVSVIDFDMPFTSIVRMMLKWAIAAIPALIILTIIGFLFSAVIWGVVGSMAGRLAAPTVATPTPSR